MIDDGGGTGEQRMTRVIGVLAIAAGVGMTGAIALVGWSLYEIVTSLANIF